MLSATGGITARPVLPGHAEKENSEKRVLTIKIMCYKIK